MARESSCESLQNKEKTRHLSLFRSPTLRQPHPNCVLPHAGCPNRREDRPWHLQHPPKQFRADAPVPVLLVTRDGTSPWNIRRRVVRCVEHPPTCGTFADMWNIRRSVEHCLSVEHRGAHQGRFHSPRCFSEVRVRRKGPGAHGESTCQSTTHTLSVRRGLVLRRSCHRPGDP